MRATIDVHEKRGIFSLEWIVETSVEFSAAEHAAIDHGRIGSTVLYTRRNSEGTEYDYHLSDLRKAGSHKDSFSFPLDAGASAAHWEHTLLPKIKGLIEAVNNFKTGTRVIEL